MVAQTLEYLVRLRDMLLLVGCIVFKIDMIEVEMIVVNGHKSLLFDFLLQGVHGLSLNNFD